MADSLALKSKDELLSMARSAKNKLQAIKYDRKETMGRILGHMAAAGGGAAGAAVKKFLPHMTPKNVSPEAALLGAAVLLDAAVLAMGDLEYSNEANYFAAGFEGYIAGTLTEKILP